MRRLLSPWFMIESHYAVGFGRKGPLGGTIERMIYLGLLRRFSGSIAVVAKKAH